MVKSAPGFMKGKPAAYHDWVASANRASDRSPEPSSSNYPYYDPSFLIEL